MKKLVEKRGVRVLAAVLLIVFLLMSALAAVIVHYGRWDGWYSKGSDIGFEDTWACYDYISSAANYVADNVTWVEDLTLDGLGTHDGAAFSYVIRDKDGNITADTRENDSVYVAQVEGSLTTASSNEPDQILMEDFTVEGYVNLPVKPYDGCYIEYVLFSTFFPVRYILLAAQFLCLALAAVMLVFLCLGAADQGRKGRLSRTLRLPFDLVVILGGLLFFLINDLRFELVEGLLFLVRSFTGSFAYQVFGDASYSLAYAAGWLILSFLLWYMSGQLGAKCFWKGLYTRRLLHRIPGWVIVAAVAALQLVLSYAAAASQSLVILVLLWGTIVAVGAYWIIGARQARKVQQGAAELSAGNLQYKTELKKPIYPWNELSDHLNRIGDGMARAVEERMRSERMKTELITNVSHDLKTPLTSLINYIDLLKTPGLSEETRLEYLDILNKQSAKLKKLTEDVVEASKAASGAMTVRMEPINAAELLDQMVGEYTDRMRAARLTPVLTLPKDKLILSGDSVLLGRVLENLITNLIKYAQPETRVYFDLAAEQGNVQITVKNISREPLNISAEELMERFVRGDSSRHSEGSGLGLSIAKSLAELMGGRLSLILDGDLFKAILTFPAEETPPEGSEKSTNSAVK